MLGLSPLEAGLWSLPSAIGFIVGSTFAPRILRRVRPAYVIGAGLAMGAVGLAMLTRVEGTDDLALVVAASVIVSLGLAPVFTATTELIVGSAPLEQAGAASGISETGAELGGALGIAILGSIGAAVYRNELADLLPTDIPADAAGSRSRYPRRGGRRGRRTARTAGVVAGGSRAGARSSRGCA